MQMRAPWGEAKKSHLLKPPVPKMHASVLPCFEKWDVTWGGGGGDGQLHDICVAVHAGGLKFFTGRH